MVYCKSRNATRWNKQPLSDGKLQQTSAVLFTCVSDQHVSPGLHLMQFVAVQISLSRRYCILYWLFNLNIHIVKGVQDVSLWSNLAQRLGCPDFNSSASILLTSNREHFQLVVKSITSKLPLWMKRWEGKKWLLQAVLKNHKPRPGRRNF